MVIEAMKKWKQGKGKSSVVVGAVFTEKLLGHLFLHPMGHLHYPL